VYKENQNPFTDTLLHSEWRCCPLYSTETPILTPDSTP